MVVTIRIPRAEVRPVRLGKDTIQKIVFTQEVDEVAIENLADIKALKSRCLPVIVIHPLLFVRSIERENTEYGKKIDALLTRSVADSLEPLDYYINTTSSTNAQLYDVLSMIDSSEFLVVEKGILNYLVIRLPGCTMDFAPNKYDSDGEALLTRFEVGKSEFIPKEYASRSLDRFKGAIGTAHLGSTFLEEREQDLKLRKLISAIRHPSKKRRKKEITFKNLNLIEVNVFRDIMVPKFPANAAGAAKLNRVLSSVKGYGSAKSFSKMDNKTKVLDVQMRLDAMYSKHEALIKANLKKLGITSTSQLQMDSSSSSRDAHTCAVYNLQYSAPSLEKVVASPHPGDTVCEVERILLSKEWNLGPVLGVQDKDPRYQQFAADFLTLNLYAIAIQSFRSTKVSSPLDPRSRGVPIYRSEEDFLIKFYRLTIPKSVYSKLVEPLKQEDIEGPLFVWKAGARSLKKGKVAAPVTMMEPDELLKALTSTTPSSLCQNP